MHVIPKRNLSPPEAAGMEEPAIRKLFPLRIYKLFHSKII